MNEGMNSMSEIKKITAKEITANMKDYEPETTIIEWRGLEIVVKKTISFAEMARIVETVTEACFSPDGDYLPVCRDVMWTHEIITAYTNVELPDDAEECHTIIYDADLFDTIIEAISSSQYGELWSALTASIRYRVNNEAQALKKNVESMVENFSRVVHAFDGVSAEDISGVFGAFANGGIDESKIVNAILEQHKNQESI